MDFYVYDNIMTFNKRNPENGVKPFRYIIDRIEIPSNNSFWFFTGMELMVNNVNLHRPYIHIHPGIGTTNDFKFDKDTTLVTRKNLKYDPKTKMVEIGGGFLKKPIFMKKVIYYGSKHPTKKMNISGDWFYHFPSNSINFILDYFPTKIQYHWEIDEGEEMPTVEQYARVNYLEEEIKKVTNALNNAGRVSDL